MDEREVWSTLKEIEQLLDYLCISAPNSLSDQLYITVLRRYCEANSNNVPLELFTEIQNRISSSIINADDTHSDPVRITIQYSTDELQEKKKKLEELYPILYKHYGVIRNRYSEVQTPLSLNIIYQKFNSIALMAIDYLSHKMPDSPDHKYFQFQSMYHALFSGCSDDTLFSQKVESYSGHDWRLNDALEAIHSNPANAEYFKRFYAESERYLKETYHFFMEIRMEVDDIEARHARNFFDWQRIIRENIRTLDVKIERTAVTPIRAIVQFSQDSAENGFEFNIIS